MSTHAERLESLINKLNLNARSFAIELGYSRADSIYAIFKRNSKISNSLLNKICNRFPQVSREWLMTGFGSMFTKQQDDDLTVTAKQVIDKLQPLFNTSKDAVDDKIISAFFKEFAEVKNQMADIHEKLNSIELIEALKMIKELQKKDNNIKL